MKKFDVFHHPSRGYEAVKEGFSWPGFFFNLIWAFVKKMPGLGAALLGIFFFLGLIDGAAGSEGVSILISFLSLGISIAVGANGNKWRKERLPKLGYRHCGTFDAETTDGAIAMAQSGSHLSHVPSPS